MFAHFSLLTFISYVSCSIHNFIIQKYNVTREYLKFVFIYFQLYHVLLQLIYYFNILFCSLSDICKTKVDNVGSITFKKIHRLFGFLFFFYFVYLTHKAEIVLIYLKCWNIIVLFSIMLALIESSNISLLLLCIQKKNSIHTTLFARE